MRALLTVLSLLAAGCGRGPHEGTWQLVGTLKDTAPDGLGFMLPQGNFELAQPDAETLRLFAFGCELGFTFDGDEDYRLDRSQTCITTEPVVIAGHGEPIAPPLFVRLMSGNVHVSGGHLELQVIGSVGGRDVQLDASGRQVRCCATHSL